jgi:hypothetical protein
VIREIEPGCGAPARAQGSQSGEDSLYRAAALVAQHYEERRVQVHRGVLQRAHHFRRHDVARDAHHEQFPERLVGRIRRYQLGAAGQSIGAVCLTVTHGRTLQ